MCGIAGGNLFTTDTIKESLDDTKHRGYDAQLVYEDGDTNLGHNRLSIQDLSENAKGVYFLRIISDKGGMNKKVHMVPKIHYRKARGRELISHYFAGISKFRV